MPSPSASASPLLLRCSFRTSGRKYIASSSPSQLQSLSQSRLRSQLYSSPLTLSTRLQRRRQVHSNTDPPPHTAPLPQPRPQVQPRKRPQTQQQTQPRTPPGPDKDGAGGRAPPTTAGLSLRTKSIILAIAIAVVAAGGAVIGASLRQEFQRSTRQGSGLFSKVGSVQVVGAEALSYGAEGVESSERQEVKVKSGLIGGNASSNNGRKEGAGSGSGSGSGSKKDNTHEAGNDDAQEEGDDDDSIAAQIKVLEARKAALVQQRLMTEKKMERLREREREKEQERQQQEPKSQGQDQK